MATDFFVAASLVLIFFCLFFAALFFGLYVSKKDRLESLKKQEPAAPQEQAVKIEMAEPSKGTPLDKEMLRQAIRFNGFIPCESENGWLSFNVQGKTFVCKYENGAFIYFGIRYNIDMTDEDLPYELLVRAAKKVGNDTFIGRIIICESNIDYMVQGVELTYEHLCMSFMTYVHLLDDLIARHHYEYAQLKDAEDNKQCYTEEIQGKRTELS